MNKEIATRLSIANKEVAHFVSITLTQKFNAHHDFEVVLHQDNLLQGGHTFSSSLDHIGKFVVIGFGKDDSSDNVFRGLITQASLRQGQGRWANLVLKGHSPTILMEGGDHFDSYLETDLSRMVKELASNLASNDLNLVVQPAFTRELAYACQYRESNFAFMNRLAVEHGEWFYFDGQNLYFGRPQSSKPIELLYGEHLQELDFSLRLVPNRVKHYSYNAEEDQLNTGQGGQVASNSHMKKVLDTTNQLYGQTVIGPALIPLKGQGELDELVNQQKGAKAARTVVLNAKGDDPRVKLGGLVKVTLQQHPSSGQASEEGEYLVTSITHTISDIGSYSHTFEAIPSANEYIPAEAPKPVAESQLAEVTDNEDPLGMGRVKVQMLWQAADNKSTDWLRVLMPDAGGSETVSTNRGHVFIPEVGDQVVLGFRHNDPDRPFVMGSLYNGKNGKGGGKDNAIKSIKTKSGHSLEFDDTGKGTSITLKDPAGNSIFLDTKGKNITITAPETMTWKAKNMVLDIDENMTCDIGKDMKTTVGANHTLSIKEKYQLSSSETKESVDEDKSVTIKGDLKVQTASTKWSAKEGDLHFESAATAILQGKSDAKLNKG